MDEQRLKIMEKLLSTRRTARNLLGDDYDEHQEPIRKVIREYVAGRGVSVVRAITDITTTADYRHMTTTAEGILRMKIVAAGCDVMMEEETTNAPT